MNHSERTGRKDRVNASGVTRKRASKARAGHRKHRRIGSELSGSGCQLVPELEACEDGSAELQDSCTPHDNGNAYSNEDNNNHHNNNLNGVEVGAVGSFLHPLPSHSAAAAAAAATTSAARIAAGTPSPSAHSVPPPLNLLISKQKPFRLAQETTRTKIVSSLLPEVVAFTQELLGRKGRAVDNDEDLGHILE
eukprot:Colp12_sorted_trinity150504_noHs@4619